MYELVPIMLRNWNASHLLLFLRKPGRTHLDMLDGFEILTTSGVVLWSRSYVPVSTSLINGFIRDVFIEEKVVPGGSIAEASLPVVNPPYKKDHYTLKWISVRDFGLIFVVCIFPLGENIGISLS